MQSRPSWLLIAVAAIFGAVGVWQLVERLRPEHAPPPVVEPSAEPAKPSSDGARRPLDEPRAAQAAHETGPAPAAGLANPAAGDMADELARLNNEAVRHLEVGELEPAVEKLQRCVEGDPEREVFRANLAEALARLARVLHDEKLLLVPAIEKLERAVELAPERKELAELLARWHKERADQLSFWHDQSAHFDLSYAGERADLLDAGPRLIDALEAAYDEFREKFGVDFAGRGRPLVQVVLYRRDEYRARTGLGDWSSGAFDGVVRLPIEQLATELHGLRGVLRHELAHAFAKAVGGGKVPGWLNEGVAQWVEGRGAGELDWARRTARGQTRIGIERLRGTLSSWEDKSTIGHAYVQSLALVLALEREFGERFVYELVSACGRDENPELVVERMAGRRLDEFEF
jgi:hypothetical protein